MSEIENQNQDVKNNEKNNVKTKKIVTFSLVGLVALIILIVLIVFLISALGKPSKKVSETLVKDYLEAVNDDDGDKFVNLIDINGYVIYKEEDAKKFDKKYKDKDKYLKNYLEDNNYDDESELEDSIASSFESKNSYNYLEYSFKEITSIEKSSKSNNIIIIKAKVKSKSKYSDSTDTKNLKLYVIKVSGKYKIVGADLD